MTAAVVALSVAVIGLAVLVAGLLRSHAEILRALHELGAGIELDQQTGARPRSAPGPQPLVLEPFAPSAGAPERPSTVVGETLDGDLLELPLSGQGDTLLAFLSSGCVTCQNFWEAFAAGPVAVPGGARLVVVAQSEPDESPSALRSRSSAGLTMVQSSEAWGEFSVPGSPYFVYVDGASGRVVGEGSAASWPQVVDLMGQARADDVERTGRGLRGKPGRNARDTRDERALAEAGIGPGHASLLSDGTVGPPPPADEP